MVNFLAGRGNGSNNKGYPPNPSNSATKTKGPGQLQPQSQSSQSSPFTSNSPSPNSSRLNNAATTVAMAVSNPKNVEILEQTFASCRDEFEKISPDAQKEIKELLEKVPEFYDSAKEMMNNVFKKVYDQSKGVDGSIDITNVTLLMGETANLLKKPTTRMYVRSYVSKISSMVDTPEFEQKLGAIGVYFKCVVSKLDKEKKDAVVAALNMLSAAITLACDDKMKDAMAKVMEHVNSLVINPANASLNSSSPLPPPSQSSSSPLPPPSQSSSSPLPPPSQSSSSPSQSSPLPHPSQTSQTGGRQRQSNEERSRSGSRFSQSARSYSNAKPPLKSSNAPPKRASSATTSRGKAPASSPTKASKAKKTVDTKGNKKRV